MNNLEYTLAIILLMVSSISNAFGIIHRTILAPPENLIMVLAPVICLSVSLIFGFIFFKLKQYMNYIILIILMTSFINFPFLLITSNSMSFIEYLPMMGSAIGLLTYKNWKWSLTGIPCVALYIFIILVRLDQNLYLGDSAPDIWVRANYINLLGGFTASFVFACVLVAFSVHCMRVYIHKVEHLNKIDYLTGCFNKATYNKTLLTEKINKKDITFLGILDIDFFKKVNDELGHQAGDTALVVLSHILQEIVSENLQVYRFGGEEFVLLTNVSEAEFFKKLKKLWNLLDSHFIISERPLTVSIGIVKTKGIDSSTWFDLADAQMYEAKHAGRHCVYYNSQKVM